MHDFNDGDIVILRGLVTNREQEEFRGGWVESGMREWVGLKAKVVDAYWDNNYMDHFYEMKEVSAEE